MDNKEISCETTDFVSETGTLSESVLEKDASAPNAARIDGPMQKFIDSHSIVTESPSLPIEMPAVEKEHLDKIEAVSCSTLEQQSESSANEIPMEESMESHSIITESPSLRVEMPVVEKENLDKIETVSCSTLDQQSQLSGNEIPMEESIESHSIIIESTSLPIETPVVEKENLDQIEAAPCSTLEQQSKLSDNEISMEKTPQKEPATSLSVIALAYDNSDSESEQSECVSLEKNSKDLPNQMDIQITKEYRTVQVSSDEESDSDDSSSNSSSENSSSDVESDESDCVEKNSKKNSDTEQRNEKNNGRRRTVPIEKESKGEFDDLPPIEDLKISVPEVLCDPLGEVAWMVEQMVVVRPKPGKPTLNLDTILFVERGRRVLGRIFDVFGQVSDPHYCVRFNSTDHIKESDIKVGMTAYFCPNTEYTSVVFLQDLLKMKATDELGDDEHPEFSDDEEERAYYASLKQKQKGEKAKNVDEVPQKRQRTGQEAGWKSNHPWSSGRKQEQSRKPDKNYNAPGWAGGGAQQNVRHPGTSWQHYPPAYPGVPWSPATDPQRYGTPPQGWHPACPPPQNSYNYPPRNSRPPFRPPPHPFHSGPAIPCMQSSSGPYAQQSNPRPFGPPVAGGVNFPWQPRQPTAPVSWRFPPPPPPPPPPGL